MVFTNEKAKWADFWENECTKEWEQRNVLVVVTTGMSMININGTGMPTFPKYNLI